MSRSIVTVKAWGASGSGKTLVLRALKRLCKTVGCLVEMNDEGTELTIVLNEASKQALADIEQLVPTLRN
jgi:hypothetical protein